MIRKLQLTVILCLIVCTISISAQKEMRIADKQFELNVYDLAIESYQSALKVSPLNYHAMSRIAESYLLMNKIVDAEKWYSKVITMRNINPIDILNYGHTLKKLGKYNAAKKHYEAYREIDFTIGSHYAESCDFVDDILSQEKMHSISFFNGNSDKSEFGISFYNGHMVFASFNDQMKRRVYQRNKSHVQSSGNQLFVVDNSGNNYQFLRPEIKEIYNIGPVAYDANGKKIAYTKNNFVDGRVSVTLEETDLSIYLATVLDNGDFVNDRSFPYNSSLYANAFPFLTDDGQTMYFASNMIGGYGGFDLYVTHYVEGEWTIPENLGSEINSAGNEICPSIDENNLYFSSDYHYGIGGFDVFYCENSFGEWSFPQNMGKVINSSSDDYFFAVNPMNGKMYFSSNRIGGKGKDDIYIAVPKKRAQFAKNVVPQKSKNNMPNVAVLTSNIETNPVEISTPEYEIVETKILIPESAEVTVATNEIDEIEMDGNMPAAVSLKDMEVKKETKPEASHVKTVSMKMVKNASSDNSFDMGLARKVSHGSVLNAVGNVYFIQLASLSKTAGNFSRFKSFVQYGNLYKVYKTNTIKIRLGHYNTREEAMVVLMKIRKSGVQDAFLVKEPLITSQLELIAANFTEDIYQEDNTFVPKKTRSNYKVRLASYTDPLWFDTEAVGSLGEIEQWTKGEWTIFVLSGYADLEEAKAAHVKALNRGFTEAHIVVDNKGILEKLIEN
jgi:tetratricopeptide (TPR) repeat protein